MQVFFNLYLRDAAGDPEQLFHRPAIFWGGAKGLHTVATVSLYSGGIFAINFSKSGPAYDRDLRKSV